MRGVLGALLIQVPELWGCGEGEDAGDDQAGWSVW
jgi:hypothetical protein